MVMRFLLSIIMFFAFAATAQAEWSNNYWQSLEKAKAEKKFVFLYLTQNNCPWCDRFEQTLAHPYLKKYIETYYVPCKVNINRQPAIHRGFKPYLKGCPAYYIINNQQKIRANSQGYRTPIEFARWNDAIWRKK